MTTVDAAGEREGAGGERNGLFRKQLEGDSRALRPIIGSLQREAAAFYRLSVASCGSSLNIKNDVWCMLLKEKEKKRGKNP